MRKVRALFRWVVVALFIAVSPFMAFIALREGVNTRDWGTIFAGALIASAFLLMSSALLLIAVRRRRTTRQPDE